VIRITDKDREILMELLMNVAWTDCRVTKLTNETKIYFDLGKNPDVVYRPGNYCNRKQMVSTSFIMRLTIQ
jgi:hypothetical protein